MLQTSRSIVDIALANGFISALHFSKCYRDMFGNPHAAFEEGPGGTLASTLPFSESPVSVRHKVQNYCPNALIVRSCQQ